MSRSLRQGGDFDFWTRGISQHKGKLLYAELRTHFSEEQLIELAASAAQENYRARYNRVFDVGSDGLYRKGLKIKQR